MTDVPAPEALQFGAEIRHLWRLADDALTVNHGAYGATPIEVLDEQDRWRRMMEAQPTYFMQRILPVALRHSAEVLARFISADPDRVVFVENTTTGINAILRSLHIQKNDEILLLSHSYGAVRKAVDYVASRCGALIVDATIPFPRPERETLLANLEDTIGPRTRLAILDHITSASGLVLPIDEMVQICRKNGVAVVVDGAHAPGQIPIDIGALGADWYVGNCHKWLMAPKGTAFLWARPGAPDIHPTTISHGFGAGFLAEFDWVGTRDWSACLSVAAAIRFYDKLGGATVMDRSHALAVGAAKYLADQLQTRVAADRDWHAAMPLVEVPTTRTPNTELAAKLREDLLDRRCDASVSFLDGSIWLRLSAAPYNDFADFVGLADMIAKVNS